MVTFLLKKIEALENTADHCILPWWHFFKKCEVLENTDDDLCYLVFLLFCSMYSDQSKLYAYETSNVELGKMFFYNSRL